jgi:alanine dehydrogenase
MLRRMKPRSVFMDLAIDMGGCAETSRPTYFPNPTFEAEGVVHFCVPNLPTMAARSATQALTNTLLPWVIELAEHGVDATLETNLMLRRGTYLHHGRCVMANLCELFGLEPAALGA